MSNYSSLKVAIVGASGYAGAELATILSRHPYISDVVYAARALVGKKVAAEFPALRGCVEAVFVKPDPKLFAECDAVFYATPHAVAMHDAEEILATDTVLIDLSPDFRLRDMAVFQSWYGAHAAPALVPKAVYGLTEVVRADIKNTSLIACPGCLATAVELALIPLVADGLIDGQVVADVKTGVSGAGKRTERAELLFAEQSENFKIYAADGHRHQPEIEQAIADFGGQMPPLVFRPHLLPTTRGIYATIYAPIKQGADCAASLQKYWRDEIFIDVLDDTIPELAQVVRTNRVQLHARPINDTTALIIAALDNLQKGAAGQAVQNMNVRFGLPEAAGLFGARNLR